MRGINDVASAAHRLFTAGYDVVIHAESTPTTTRRGMTFADAVFDGRASLVGVDAVRLEDVRKLADVVRGAIPVCLDGFVDIMQAIRTFAPGAIVDARMQKRQKPEHQRGSAELLRDITRDGVPVTGGRRSWKSTLVAEWPGLPSVRGRSRTALSRR